MMSTWSLIGVVVVLLAVATCLAVNPYNDIVNDSRSFSSRQPLNVSELMRQLSESDREVVRTRVRRQAWNEETRNVVRRRKTECCHRIDFHVNFLELGWDKWIIYPQTFNAHLCTGNCTLPLRKRKRTYTSSKVGAGISTVSVTSTTNHAQIMSILEYKHPEMMSQQMTKCVSTKLSPLKVIFYNEYGQIKTKLYEDMIVEECGCR